MLVIDFTGSDCNSNLNETMVCSDGDCTGRLSDRSVLVIGEEQSKNAES